MSRQLRIEYEGAFYHVTSRGHQRRRIFADDYSRKRFLAYLHEYLTKFNVTLYSYIFMRNHYHLLLKTKFANLSIFMHSLNSAYSSYYNKKMSRNGALFQGRYDAEIVESEDYFLEATRYIHLNPVRAFIVKNPKDYSWSSYGTYLGIKDDPYISVSWIMNYFENESAREYERFVLSKLDAENPFRRIKHLAVLGSDQFLFYLQRYMESFETNVYDELSNFRQITRQNAEKVIAFVCKEFKVERKEIFQKRKGNVPQKMTIYLLKRFTGLSVSHIAQMLSSSYAATEMVYARMKRKYKHSRMFKRFLLKFELCHPEMQSPGLL
ncbi:MAG: hypothetical protein A2Y62_02015 [Candidatus Fischerbacteria bacterium RBG_13_37_8]|uniref:Transposase IS200-like domain-containing protein n=1 Tax=Candidatus Fischerbacteria bacterium RBG_13_37_8 TaxID=1817863 RepID=A0A1F5VJK3_9BACT|nr:MAG: hypothetical protein A2Y62_02015 [Candidatus Fischerbacteria bacterium RBG_13_37_8]